MTRYRAFAIDVRAPFALPGAWGADPGDDRGRSPVAATELVVGPLPELVPSASAPASAPAPAPAPEGWEGINDGRRLQVQAVSGGDHRFVYGGRPVFHLSADHRTLTTGSPAHADIHWWRILMDSVLFTVSLLRGHEALHAAACAGEGGALAIVAGTGGGKSTLLAELLSRGRQLVTDDVLFVEERAGTVLAHPGPPLMTLPRHGRTELLTPLGEVGDELWGAVATVAQPVALRRIVVLDRRPGAATTFTAMARPLAALVGNLLAFPAGAAREAARFSLAAAVASQAEIWQLVSDVSTSPAALADIVMHGAG